MRYHSANQCLKAANAIKQQVDYLLFAIGNKDNRDCEHHLDVIRQLVDQLKGEVNGSN
jgi:mannitol/fructose-specific phosphotransferase system IIA component (Ntr-type)